VAAHPGQSRYYLIVDEEKGASSAPFCPFVAKSVLHEEILGDVVVHPRRGIAGDVEVDRGGRFLALWESGPAQAGRSEGPPADLVVLAVVRGCVEARDAARVMRFVDGTVNSQWSAACG
jgi:hypothetical protein